MEAEEGIDKNSKLLKIVVSLSQSGVIQGKLVSKLAKLTILMNQRVGMLIQCIKAQYRSRVATLRCLKKMI